MRSADGIRSILSEDRKKEWDDRAEQPGGVFRMTPEELRALDSHIEEGHVQIHRELERSAVFHWSNALLALSVCALFWVGLALLISTLVGGE